MENAVGSSEFSRADASLRVYAAKAANYNNKLLLFFDAAPLDVYVYIEPPLYFARTFEAFGSRGQLCAVDNYCYTNKARGTSVVVYSMICLRPYNTEAW